MNIARPPLTPHAATRWRWLLPISASLLAACAGPSAVDAGAAARRAGAMPGAVSVTHADPAQFRNADGGGHESAASRRAWLNELSEHLAERAAAVLPAGQRLQVQITDVQRAGAFEPSRGVQGSDLRIVRDAYPPRIDLMFKRLAANGQVLQSGSRQLRDQNFLMRPNRYGNDALGFEKRLVDDWVEQEFGAVR
jgi:hypothetical protein